MILDRILKDKNEELEISKRQTPLDQIKILALEEPEPFDLAACLKSDRIQIIAEVKKASPSRGIICNDFDPLKIAKTYAENQVAAISILTENRYFQGSLDYLMNINRALGGGRPPLLRKDFIFDSYQIYESRAYGADALLLIAAILSEDKLKELLDLSHSLHMKCLVEVHNENELDLALKSKAKIIGINNRDLRTFETNLDTTARLSRQIPENRIVVSESGIKNRSDMEKLKAWNVNAVLIGETLITSKDIGAKIRELT